MPRNTKHNQARRNLALDQRRQRVFEAWSKGEPQYAIAVRENVNKGQVCRDLAHVLAELHGRGLDDAAGSRKELLGKIAHAETELLAAWERSKQDRERRKAKTVNRPGKLAKGKAKSVAATTTEGEKITEGRDGNYRFIGELRALWELRARLENLLKPEGLAANVAVVTVVGGIDLQVVTGQKPGLTHERIVAAAGAAN